MKNCYSHLYFGLCWLILLFSTTGFAHPTNDDLSPDTASTLVNGPQWTAVGPLAMPTGNTIGGMGRITAVAIDPNDHNTVYCGAATGGIWKTTDAGASWEPVGDNLPMIAITSIAIDPKDSQTLYALTGDRIQKVIRCLGVYKSTDGGSTWDATGLTFNGVDDAEAYKVAVSPANSDIIMAGTSTGFMVSEDAGATWTKVISWKVIDIAFKPDDGNVGYACTRSGYVARTLDGGKTWEQLTDVAQGLPGAATSYGLSRVAVSAAKPERIYFVLTNNDGYRALYYSDNAGDPSVSFNDISFTEQKSTTDGLPEMDQSGFAVAFAVSQTDPNVLTAGGLDTYRSTDLGVTWTQITTGGTSSLPYMHVDMLTYEYAGSSQTMYVGCDGGLYRSSDDGQTFVNISDGLMVAQAIGLAASPSAPDFVIYGAQDNGCNKIMTATGETTMLIGSDGASVAIPNSTADTLILQCQIGFFRKFGNATPQMITLPAAGSWTFPAQFVPGQPRTLIAGLVDLYSTEDYGDTWTNLTNGATNTSMIPNSLSICKSDVSRMYMSKKITLTSAVYGGANADGTWTWTDITPPQINSVTYASWVAVSPTNPDHLWVAMSGYVDGTKVVVSSDGGKTWTLDSNGLPNLPGNSLISAGGDNNAIYYGTYDGVYYKDDTLNSWVKMNNGLPNAMVREMIIHPVSGELYVATYGRGVWKMPQYGE